MRLATSNDVLDDRPTEWPKPPPGFTTKRVLMPWHDFSKRGGGRKDNKRRRRDSGGNGGGKRNNRRRSRDDEYNVEEKMNTGLRGRSGGYTVEELEAERRAKNAVVLDIA